MLDYIKTFFINLFKLKQSLEIQNFNIVESIDISDDYSINNKNKMTDEEFYQFLKENNISKEEYNSW